MRISLWSASLVVLMMLAAPARADAGYIMAFFHYLDNLSGPGPFAGVGVSADILCDDASGFKVCSRENNGAGGDFSRIAIGPHVAWLYGYENEDLVYPDGTPDNDKDVVAVMYGGHATAFFTRNIGATVSFTRYRFSGELVSDESQSRMTIGVGPVFSLRGSRFRLDVSPMVVFGLDDFDVDDFGITGPPLEDNVKGAIQFGVSF